MIDASDLRTDRPDVVATFHPDGQLASLHVTLSAGDTTSSMTLTLDPAQLAGRAESGTTVIFDPTNIPDSYGGYAHDNDPDEVTPAMHYENWVQHWIAQVYDLRLGTAFVCSFCGKDKHEVRRLIAGPAVYICDECIGLCNQIIAEEDAKS